MMRHTSFVRLSFGQNLLHIPLKHYCYAEKKNVRYIKHYLHELLKSTRGGTGSVYGYGLISAGTI